MTCLLERTNGILTLGAVILGAFGAGSTIGQELLNPTIDDRFKVEMTDEMESKVREKYQSIVDAMGNGQWKLAVKQANRLISDLRDSRADSSPSFAARVLLLRSLANAALGNTRDALWDYDVACAFLPEIEEMELALFPPASNALEVLLSEREPCRSAPDALGLSAVEGQNDTESSPIKLVPEERVKRRVAPDYPWGMRALHISGSLLVNTCVDRSGIPTEPQLSVPMPIPFMLAALESLATWRYEPATVDERPVPTEYISVFRFSITWNGKGATGVR